MPERLCMCKICSIFADAKEKRVMAGKSFYFVIQKCNQLKRSKYVDNRIVKCQKQINK